MRQFSLIGLMLVSAVAFAGEARSNVASFDATASREVANDTAWATLYVELTDADPVRLAGRINEALAAALKTAKQGGAMQSVSTGYANYPLYNKSNRQEGWRGRGELRLVARDFAALSRLIGELQQPKSGLSLQLAEIRYGVSDEARRKAEDELIEESLRAFRSRAALVQNGMGSKGWKLLDVSVRSQSPRPPMLYRAAPMAAESLSSAAPVEGGESRLNVTVQGSIQLE